MQHVFRQRHSIRFIADVPFPLVLTFARRCLLARRGGALIYVRHDDEVIRGRLHTTFITFVLCLASWRLFLRRGCPILCRVMELPTFRLACEFFCGRNCCFPLSQFHLVYLFYPNG